MTLQEILEFTNGLALQLEKLLKVINHSDPTAENKKILLHEKYQHKTHWLAENCKHVFAWQDLKISIYDHAEKNWDITPVNLRVIRNKIIKDLEQAFIEKPKFEEFSVSEHARIQQQIKQKKLKLKKQRAIQAGKPKRYTKESIMEMVQVNQRQRAARIHLRDLISRINELNPEKLEVQIKHFLQKEKK